MIYTQKNASTVELAPALANHLFFIKVIFFASFSRANEYYINSFIMEERAFGFAEGEMIRVSAGEMEYVNCLIELC